MRGVETCRTHRAEVGEQGVDAAALALGSSQIGHGGPILVLSRCFCSPTSAAVLMLLLHQIAAI
jgi:hypothetical protein